MGVQRLADSRCGREVRKDVSRYWGTWIFAEQPNVSLSSMLGYKGSYPAPYA